jgi:phosphinothricin acetyltransferase
MVGVEMVGVEWLDSSAFSAEDIAWIGDVRNDPSVVWNSLNRSTVSDEHNAFFWKHAGQRESFYGFLVRVEGERAGVLCFDAITCEVSIFLHRMFRGRGVGCWCVDRLCREVFSQGIDRVEAVVRPENSAAICMFQAAGFQIVSRTDFVRMRRVAPRRWKWLSKFW